MKNHNPQLSKEMEHIFTYGTLMCSDIMQEVSGCQLSHLAGVLKDYSRRSVKGECFPAITRDVGKKVHGLIYLDVVESAWDRLDRFEGEMYIRQPVKIELRGGSTISAQTYVVNPLYQAHLESFDWDYEQFLRSSKEKFQNGYGGYQFI